MEVQEVEIIMDEEGRITIQVHGMKGISCVELTKELIEALGGEIESQELTAEAYATVQEEVKNEQKLKGES